MINEVLARLEKMVGTEFDESDVIVAFESENDVIVDEVQGQESNFEGRGLCKCYNAYENAEDSEIFTIYVDENNEVVEVR